MPATNARKYLIDPQVTPATRSHINFLTTALYTIQDKISLIAKHGLSKQEAHRLYSAGALREHFLAGGKHALTIHNMLGQAAEPQLANIPITVGSAGGQPTNLSSQDAGHVYIAQDIGHQFIWTGSSWSMLDGAGYGTFSTVHPQPSAFWVQVPTGGGTVNVTKPDASGTSAVTFPSYTPPAGGYTLWVRI